MKARKKTQEQEKQDPDLLVCEIFKEDTIGDDLKLSILLMMNRIKEETQIPEGMRTASIIMLHKKNVNLI